jgi:hypothetical protein
MKSVVIAAEPRTGLQINIHKLKAGPGFRRYFTVAEG